MTPSIIPFSGSVRSGRARALRHLKALTWAALLTLTLTNCSLRVSYPFMDWWLGWQVKDYISLSPSQDDQLETVLDRFHLWHQHTQLITYANTMDELESELQHPSIEPEILAVYGARASELWLASLDYLLPDVQRLFLSISEAQWSEFKHNLTEHIEEEAEPVLDKTPEERLQRRTKRFEKAAKKWIGRLDPQQKQWVREWGQSLHFLTEVDIQEKRLWMNKADQLFQNRFNLSEEQLQQQLNDLIAGDASRWTPGNQQLLEENRHQTMILMSKLHASLSDKQRKRLFEKLSSYRNDLIYLFEKAQAAR